MTVIITVCAIVTVSLIVLAWCINHAEPDETDRQYFREKLREDEGEDTHQ